ncbi:hypothetical protein [Microtetraspora sp. NBRC 16547]|uniref:WXG100-like domain-containing protein n=1 Tax=Microtetraspora sp. NBRC 16547 TaxID=3030993 RepID=UPI0024A00CB5|nr:hypothetical protein [Microtetraspora sp. NBRC 16547]GLX00106.1 hypothetical protein Misp02_41920 [Microtetraspora sp. NBRC 16547]
MDWPEGDETGCFRLADACVTAAHEVVAGTRADQPESATKIGQAWDGEAHLAFAEHVSKVSGKQVADLVKRLIDAAIALNNVGVQIQYAKYMIEATVWLLIVQLGYLLAIAVPSGGSSLALIPARVQLARLTVAQIAKRTLTNIMLFAGIVAGMDAGVQLLQMGQGRRDDLDGRQLVVSALTGGAMGGLMGLLSGGLSRMATPALRAGLSRAEMSTAEKLLASASSSIYGQAAQYALTGGITTAGSMVIEGDFSWDMLAKGITSSALGADGQHLTTSVPHHSTSAPHPTSHVPGADPPAGPGHDSTLARAADTTTGPGHSTTLAQAADTTTGTAPHIPARDGGSARSPHAGQDGSLATGMPTRPAPDGAPADGGRRPAERGTTERGTGTEQPSRPKEQGRAPAADATQRPAPRTAESSAPVARNTAERADGGAPPASQRTSQQTTSVSEAPTGRIEKLLNHSAEPETTGGRSSGAHAADGPEPRTSDVGPRPGGDETRPGGEPTRTESTLPDGSPHTDTATPASAHDRRVADAPAPPVPPADPADAGRGQTRVPFDFERFYNDPRWAAEATRFEQRLGAHYFNNPQNIDAARTALGKLRDVLMALTPRGADESPAAFARRVESAFFRDDKDAHSSAGQVGTGLTVDDLLRKGNLREVMTAFYNAAYFNRDNPQTLAKTILDVIDGKRWEEARAAGVDRDELTRMRRQLDESANRAILGRLEERFTPGEFRFARDPFGTGNVIMLSERGVRDLADVIKSQASRHDRTPEEQQRLGLITTPAHYEGLNTPLGRFERAFIESITDGPLRPDTPLPWREGVTAHETTSSRWARQVAGDGFPVVDGVSATTTRMLAAVKFLDLGRGTTEHFVGALMGWMLPGRDHSLFEIIRGAQIAGFGRPDFEPGARPSAVDLYRSLPDLDLGTLRTEILPDGLFPHEAQYLHHATDPGGFSETQHHKVREATERLWPQLESGRVTDPHLAEWLHRNGIDPMDTARVRELGERLSPAHVTALTVYTRHSHYLINNVTRTQLWTGGVSEAAVRTRMVQKVQDLATNYLGNLATGEKALPLPLALRPLLHVGEGHLDSRSPLSPHAQSWIDAAHQAEDAKHRSQEHRAAGRTAEARQAESEVREARKAQRAAWREIRELLDTATPRLFEEMRWHADMVHDAMMQLPALGSPDHPVLAYRGDWITPVHSPIYGSKLFPHGTAREFLSVSRLLEVAVRFMAENPASDRKVLVVYHLTGGQARDISVFSSFAADQEAVFPPHSRMRRVQNPELAERVRADVERAAADMVRRGVLPKVPGGYEIIVMEEG